MSTFWMKVPDPQVATGSGQSWQGSATITSVQSWISPVALVIFVMTVSMTLLKVSYDTRRAGEGFNGILRALVTTLASGLPLLAVTMLGLQFGDAFAPWILQQASGQDVSGGFASIFENAMLGSATGTPNASGALLIVYLLAILAGIVQILFMIVRGASIITLLCFAQATGAGTASDEGWLRWKRIAMLIMGFVLYKPVAAVIYAVGIKLMSDGATTQAQIYNAIYGLTIMVMAALALPTLIKFVAPAAAMGSSSAFSGGAAVGMLATGAAMVALAGTGGGSAAGAAAGASGGGLGGGSGAGGGGQAPGAKDATPSDGDGPTGADPSSRKEPEQGAPPEAPAAQQQGASPIAAGQSAQSAPEGSGTGGSSTASQMGAGMVQNLAGQAGQAGEDASGD
ncbi:hypothetical protein [Nocardioides maradonensis]